MTCREFEIQIVSDDPIERERGSRHAAGCEACAATLSAHQRLSERAAAWRRDEQPPIELEQRVRQALVDATPARIAPSASQESADSTRRPEWLRRAPHKAPRAWTRNWMAPALLAASLLIALTIGWHLLAREGAPEVTRRLLAVEALGEARAAERLHARAIARLERAAAPLLARAGDPQVGRNDTGKLLAYADRLAFLDSTIEQVRAYIDENPTHPHSRVTLLAAYREKTEILSEILELETAS